MANWDSIKDDFQRFILKWEGGYVNHPLDPGGHTNMGVILNTFAAVAPTYLGIPGTLENLKKLTTAQHKIILKYFWDQAKGDKYKNAAIGAYATELAWGSGPGGAKKMLRNAAATLGKKLSTASTTTTADVEILNSIDSQQLFEALTKERWRFYQSLSTWPTFGKGWSRRIIDFDTTFKKKALI
jgi:lysozyme family protein